MWPNLQKTAELVTFTEEIFNGKLHFLCSDSARLIAMEMQLLVERYVIQCFFVLFYSIRSKTKTGRWRWHFKLSFEIQIYPCWGCINRLNYLRDFAFLLFLKARLYNSRKDRVLHCTSIWWRKCKTLTL